MLIYAISDIITLLNIYYSRSGHPAEVGALFTTVSSIRVSRVGRISRVRVTLTVTVRVSRVRVTLTVTVRVSRVSIMVSVRDSVK